MVRVVVDQTRRPKAPPLDGEGLGWRGVQERGRASSGDATPTQPSPIEGEGSIWQVLEAVPDPEIPVLGITDLGIVRHADADRVVLTPTYTGCPATHVIETMVREALDAAGYRATRIETVLTPPWTTDWITGEGRAKLKAYGIAPPLPAGVRAVECPQCGSSDTAEISRFGSTPCKSLWRCHACLEPFDHFKCH